MDREEKYNTILLHVGEDGKAGGYSTGALLLRGLVSRSGLRWMDDD